MHLCFCSNSAEPEIVLEASTHPVQLSTGDYFHIYAAGEWPGQVSVYRGHLHIHAAGESDECALRSDAASYLSPTAVCPNRKDQRPLPSLTYHLACPPGLNILRAGTPGWVANGNYTGGWVILDQNDPTAILQRSKT